MEHQADNFLHRPSKLVTGKRFQVSNLLIAAYRTYELFHIMTPQHVFCTCLSPSNAAVASQHCSRFPTKKGPLDALGFIDLYGQKRLSTGTLKHQPLTSSHWPAAFSHS